MMKIGASVMNIGGCAPGAACASACDGDDKTDIAVFRADAVGAFYVKNSTNGAIVPVLWGGTNDYPVASYDTH